MKLRIGQNQMEDIQGLHSSYPYAYHDVELAKTQVPWHWHEALEFNYVVRGSVKVATPSQSRVFTQGQAFFINSNVLTAMEQQDPCRLDSHLFHPVFLSGHFKSVFETKYIDPVIHDRAIELVAIPGEDDHQQRLLRLLRELAALQQRPDTEFETRNCLSGIWLALLEVVKGMERLPGPAASRNQDRLLTMLSFIQEQYEKKLTLEQIAAAAAISPRECLRCFRGTIGISPMEYLTDYRIQAAKTLLETTRLPVTEIAGRTGFGSSAYFSKIFHRGCGKTPSQYRKALEALK